MTTKHQTTVPKEIRDKLRLLPGDLLHWEWVDRGVRVTTERPAFFELRGSIPAGPGLTVTEIRGARRSRGREKW